MTSDRQISSKPMAELLARRIKEICALRGVSKKELANESGIGISTLHLYGSGSYDGELREGTLSKLADMAMVTPEQFLDENCKIEDTFDFSALSKARLTFGGVNEKEATYRPKDFESTESIRKMISSAGGIIDAQMSFLKLSVQTTKEYPDLIAIQTAFSRTIKELADAIVVVQNLDVSADEKSK